MIEQLYPYLIVAGVTIGAVLVYLWLHARRAGDKALALIRLNESLQFDTPAFLDQAWPLLEQAGLHGIAWKLDWYGVVTQRQCGSTDGRATTRDIAVAEMRLQVTFWQGTYGEQRYFDDTLIETFLLLVRSDMWIKAGATDASFAQMSRLTLFLQHDMKNVAQFIQLLSDQVANIPAGREQQVLDYLRTAAPMMRHRADRIVNTLTAGLPAERRRVTLDLAEEVAKIAALYRLDCTVRGAASVAVPENTIDSALDNILKNYADLAARDASLRPQLVVDITDDADEITLGVTASNLGPAPHPERLFEPFWSSNPEGLGIGLYQARQLVQACGGTLAVDGITSASPRFTVRLPAAASAAL